MSLYRLSKVRFQDGLWEGQLTAKQADAPQPEIAVTLLDQTVDGVTCAPSETPGIWTLRIPVPAAAIGDGVHAFLIREAAGEEPLGSFTLVAGEVLDQDIRAEIVLLRAELDMLKRAFRHHCQQTG